MGMAEKAQAIVGTPQVSSNVGRCSAHKPYGVLTVGAKVNWDKGGAGKRKRYLWRSFELRIGDWLLQRAGIEAGDRVIVMALEPGMLVVSKLDPLD